MTAPTHRNPMMPHALDQAERDRLESAIMGWISDGAKSEKAVRQRFADEWKQEKENGNASRATEMDVKLSIWHLVYSGRLIFKEDGELLASPPVGAERKARGASVR